MTKPANSNPNVDVYYLYKVLNRQEQTGLYVQDQAQWDKVLVTLGGRYDWAERNPDRVRPPPPNVMIGSSPGAVALTTCSTTA
jgi:outer membrane receptor protein involved in Fe transport